MSGTSSIVVLVLLLWSQARAQPGWADVEPIFDERCTVCHAGAAAPRGVRLTSHGEALAGGSERVVVVPGDPAGSELVRRIRGESLPRMPLTGPPFLTEVEIGTIEAWIAAGAPGPDGAPGDPDAPPEPGGDATPATPDEDATAARAEGSEAAPGSFASVEGIFLGSCALCHAAEGALGGPPEGLILTSYDAVLRGGDRVVVVPGSPLASELYRKVEGWSRPRMPLNGPDLDPARIDAIRQWIEAGAPGPDGRAAGLPIGGEVRLRGTLTGRWALDGLPLVVTHDTRVDDAPAVGAYVEVRGVVRSDGGIDVERLRRR